MSAQEYDELKRVLESKLSPAVSADRGARRYFAPLDRQQLDHLHLTVTGLPVEFWHQYYPDAGVARPDQVSLVNGPFRASGGSNIDSMSLFLQLITFERSSLNDIAFRPRDTFGTGQLTLNEPALRAFVDLLRHG
jgi:hypothetical protein